MNKRWSSIRNQVWLAKTRGLPVVSLTQWTISARTKKMSPNSRLVDTDVMALPIHRKHLVTCSFIERIGFCLSFMKGIPGYRAIFGKDSRPLRQLVWIFLTLVFFFLAVVQVSFILWDFFSLIVPTRWRCKFPTPSFQMNSFPTIGLFYYLFLLFQVHDRIDYYLKTPIHMSVVVASNNTLVFPRITICNRNILKY